MTSLKERSIFFRECFANFHHIGSVTPSSRFLAKSITQPLVRIQNKSDSLNVLEAGAGTGSITREILKMLRRGDRLVACELNRRLARLLENDLKQPAEKKGVEYVVLCGPVQEIDRSRKFDVVISGLPMNNFNPETVDEIFNLFFDIVRPGGAISFYEYLGIRQLAKMLTNTRNKKRIKAVESTIHAWCKDHPYYRDNVWLNLPPAWTHHVMVMKRNGSIAEYK